jgi:hypothetical protein
LAALSDSPASNLELLQIRKCRKVSHIAFPTFWGYICFTVQDN